MVVRAMNGCDSGAGEVWKVEGGGQVSCRHSFTYCSWDRLTFVWPDESCVHAHLN
jgi:hypothetical protein